MIPNRVTHLKGKTIFTLQLTCNCSHVVINTLTYPSVHMQKENLFQEITQCLVFHVVTCFLRHNDDFIVKIQAIIWRGWYKSWLRPSLREKCPNVEFFLVRIFLYSVRKSPYSVQIQENTDQKKLRPNGHVSCSACNGWPMIVSIQM